MSFNSVDEIMNKIDKYCNENGIIRDKKVKPLSEYEISNLPKLPGEWRWVISNDISTFITNGVHSPTSTEDNLGINKKMLRITDLKDEKEPDFSNLPFCKRFVKGDYEKNIKKDDIYISFTGNVLGKRYIVKETREDVVFAHYFVRWQPIIVNPQYIYYVLRSNHFDRFMYENTLGSTQPNLKVTSLKRVPLPIPPMKEQERIAKIFHDIDKKIEINNKINNTLENMGQSIFKQWFVDFDFPNEDGEPYQSSGGEMIESKLGMIPKGWEVKTIADMGIVVGGATPSKKCDEYYAEKEIPWLTPKDLSNNKNLFIDRGAIDISEEGFKNSSTQILPQGSVLLSSRAPIGYVAISQNEVTTNQGFKSIVPNISNGFSSEYVYCWLKENMTVIENRATGSTFKEISGSELKKINAIIPERKLLDKYTECGHSLFKQIEGLVKKTV